MTDSLEKTLMWGKMEGRRRREQEKMRWLDSITDSMAMSLRKFWVLVMDRQAWCPGFRGLPVSPGLQSVGSQRVGHDWATELNWTCNPRLQKKQLWFYFYIITMLFVLSCQRLNPRHGWPDLQELKHFKTCSLSYLKCSPTCYACRQARNPGKVQAG